MTEQHVPVEELAAFAAGDLDAAAAVAVEAHVVLCAECRADVAALNATAAAIASVPPVAMPDEVAARVDAALAAAAEPAAGPVGDVLPMRRRRPSLAGIAAVAAGIALVGGIAVPLLREPGSPGKAATGAARDTQQEERASGTPTRRLDSGLDYTRATLAGTLVLALKGTVATTAGGTSADASRAPLAPSVPSPVGAPQAATGDAQAQALALTAVRTDPGRLAACLNELGPGQVPFVIDFARFGGKPAIVVAFPHVSSSGSVSNKLDVWVAGPRCGVVAGGDVLDFQRIDRPPV